MQKWRDSAWQTGHVFVLSFLRLCLEFITANPIFAVALPERRRNLARDVAPGVVVRPE